MSDDFVFPPLPEWGGNFDFDDSEDVFRDGAFSSIPDFDEIVFPSAEFDDAQAIIEDAFGINDEGYETEEEAIESASGVDILDNDDDDDDDDDDDIDFWDNGEDDPLYQWFLERLAPMSKGDLENSETRGPFLDWWGIVVYLDAFEGYSLVEKIFFYDGGYYVILGDSP